MIYIYTKLESPNLDLLEKSLLLSELSTTYKYFVWNEETTYLMIVLDRELNINEKLLLDTLVNLV